MIIPTRTRWSQLRKPLATFASVFLFVILTANIAAAAPIGTQSISTTLKQLPCSQMVVQLHGSKLATASCQSQSQPGSRISPNISTSCHYPLTTQKYLILYDNTNYTGASICFVGSGSANLTSYGWNDRAGSFVSNCNNTYHDTGALWWDINDSGSYFLFGPPNTGRLCSASFTGSFSAWNNQASSVLID